MPQIFAGRSDGEPRFPAGAHGAEGFSRAAGAAACRPGGRSCRRAPAGRPSGAPSGRADLPSPPGPHPSVGALRYAQSVTKEPTLATVALSNLLDAGDSRWKASRNAATVGQTVCMLVIAFQRLGHWPTQVEYAEEWNISVRTAQQQWVLFRRAFPGEQSPDRIAKELALSVGDLITERSGLTIPAPAELLAATA